MNLKDALDVIQRQEYFHPYRTAGCPLHNRHNQQGRAIPYTAHFGSSRTSITRHVYGHLIVGRSHHPPACNNGIPRFLHVVRAFVVRSVVSIYHSRRRKRRIRLPIPSTFR